MRSPPRGTSLRQDIATSIACIIEKKKKKKKTIRKIKENTFFFPSSWVSHHRPIDLLVNSVRSTPSGCWFVSNDCEVTHALRVIPRQSSTDSWWLLEQIYLTKYNALHWMQWIFIRVLQIIASHSSLSLSQVDSSGVNIIFEWNTFEWNAVDRIECEKQKRDRFTWRAKKKKSDEKNRTKVSWREIELSYQFTVQVCIFFLLFFSSFSACFAGHTCLLDRTAL